MSGFPSIALLPYLKSERGKGERKSPGEKQPERRKGKPEHRGTMLAFSISKAGRLGRVSCVPSRLGPPVAIPTRPVCAGATGRRKESRPVSDSLRNAQKRPDLAVPGRR